MSVSDSSQIADTFDPPLLLRNVHVQTIGSSLFARKPTLPAPTTRLITTQDNIRLQAFIHEVPEGQSINRQALLLHGWLGSADSTYILKTTANLLAAGYTVIRLNLRDHGDTAHLNEEMFHSARTKEVVDACVELADRPTGIIGFSLGGNFALRVCAQTELPALAICPAIDPASSCVAIDQGPLVYRSYFLRKWYRALDAKARAFPDLYDFSSVQNIKTVIELTNRFIGGHLPYPSSQEYFDAYRIRADMLTGKAARIIASKDDPVIPWKSVAQLEGHVNLILTKRGGHCGYVPDSWLNRQMLDFLEETLA